MSCKFQLSFQVPKIQDWFGSGYSFLDSLIVSMTNEMRQGNIYQFWI